MEKIEIRCPFCDAKFLRSSSLQNKQPLRFCAYCGATLSNFSTTRLLDRSFCLEPPPKSSDSLFTIGKYLVLKSIGKGGMGEVFLAYDQKASRYVALKRIRTEYLEMQRLRNRFLREAKITSQLAHPSIIPIYTIHNEGNQLYYTMPYVSGKTLRQIFNESKKQQRDLSVSIPALLRIFSNIVQAIAFAHSKGVLHRDIKPENIIIGDYGQVILLDWGLTKVLLEDEEPDNTPIVDDEPENEYLTKAGKIVGTLSYMAPERAEDKPATPLTDIYSLGIILYQMLTLALPFQRRSLTEFRKVHAVEKLIPPEIKAPYRDVSPILSSIVTKCLAKEPEARYQSCNELLQHIQSFLEGRSEWYSSKVLKIDSKDDWEFQEHVWLADHTAITRTVEHAKWVLFNLSKDSFGENVRLKCRVTLGDSSRGIGFLLGVPEAVQRTHSIEGFCIWLASDISTTKTHLLRASVTVVEDDDLILKRHRPYEIIIDKIGQHISITIDGESTIQYVSLIPTLGTHVGVYSKDGEFTLEDGLHVYVGSELVSVSCLAVPDAFLAIKDYECALSEYRRIGTSFAGRAEGREALFKAGVTLLEKAKSHSSREAIIEEAHTEFEKLRKTAGAPLEYLGKALIYESEGDFIEEAKCFELALRRYKNHPLLSILSEQIAIRMHECARYHRVAAYQFIYIVARYLPELAATSWSQNLFDSLKKYWEPLFFLSETNPESRPESKEAQRLSFSLQLAFWLNRPPAILEIIEELVQQPILPVEVIFDGLIMLTVLQEKDLTKRAIELLRCHFSLDEQKQYDSFFRRQQFITDDVATLDLLNSLTPAEALPAVKAKIFLGTSLELLQLIRKSYPLSEALATLLTEALILQGKFADAKEIVSTFVASDETSPLYFVSACLKAHEIGAAPVIEIFKQLMDIPYPKSYLLGAYYLNGSLLSQVHDWNHRSFAWEQRLLQRALQLFSQSTGF